MSESPAFIDFTILRPVWQRWWFLMIAAIIQASAIIVFERNRARRLKVLRESENRFRSLAETASDAIFAIDETSRVVFANPAAELMFGFTLAEMTGVEMSSLIPGYERPLRFAVFGGKEVTSDFSWDSRELQGMHRTGSQIPLELSFGQFTRDDRRFFTIIARDITERLQAEEALRKSKEERLAELQRVRKRIATDLHDDIGSSLTKISLLSELARQRLTDNVEEASEPLLSIGATSDELVEAMSDIVWAINPQKDHISDLLQRMRRFASDVFTARKVAFRFSASGVDHQLQLGVNVRREVFLIFKESINNVIKHSQCSEAVSEVRIEGGWLTLMIRDNGNGFDPALVEADTGYLSAQSRGGNGLASMRRRARDLAGEFEIVTGLGEGTTTFLRIPIAHQPSDHQ